MSLMNFSGSPVWTEWKIFDKSKWIATSYRRKHMKTSYIGFRALGPFGQLSFGEGPFPEFLRDELMTILHRVVTLSGVMTGW